jgi:ribosomal protein S18 acetylase RimI-like enzyme
VITFEVSRASRAVDDAAMIWAVSTAARDGDSEVAELADARPVIQGVLDRSAQSMLLIARGAAGRAAGFAAAEPAPGAAPATAQLSYFGVNPGDWGQGVGASLLRELRARLTAEGFVRGELSVYVANVRATALYERMGWRRSGAPTPHRRTGKPEQRYRILL